MREGNYQADETCGGIVWGVKETRSFQQSSLPTVLQPLCTPRVSLAQHCSILQELTLLDHHCWSVQWGKMNVNFQRWIICSHFKVRGTKNCQCGSREHNHLLPHKDEAALPFPISLLCSVHWLQQQQGPTLLFASLPNLRRWKTSQYHTLSGKLLLGLSPVWKKTIMFALLGSAMHNSACIAVSSCNPTPSVPSTCSIASLQGLCSSGNPDSAWLCCPLIPMTASKREKHPTNLHYKTETRNSCSVKQYAKQDEKRALICFHFIIF